MNAAEWVQATQELCDNATPGPWEHGDYWHIQGGEFCPCRPEWEPAIKRRMRINGKMMDAHVHRRREPIWPHGVYTTDLQKSGYPGLVVNDTEEYGLMYDSDARLIASARTRLPQAVAAIQAVVNLADEYESMVKCHRDRGEDEEASVYRLVAMELRAALETALQENNRG